ncbi:hypothetical protein ACF3OC_08560 [Sphingobacterium cellulitidis]|uniref:hypothetical protein n=1 Tax=Sphingobacterium cellulitidis TaxID=1768011 RepID=UPI00370DD406
MNKFKTINVVEPELITLLQDTANLAATQALVSVGKIPQFITKQEAFRRVGSRRKVEKWIHEGVLKVTEAGIDQNQLNAIATSANLATYVHTKLIK